APLGDHGAGERRRVRRAAELPGLRRAPDRDPQVGVGGAGGRVALQREGRDGRGCGCEQQASRASHAAEDTIRSSVSPVRGSRHVVYSPPVAVATYPGTVSPLRGLDPYGEAERDVWHGREDDRDSVAKLVTADGFRAGLLFGEPGAGKTSLL